jgi:cytidylate kinase
VPQVRARLVRLQRETVNAAHRDGRGIVVEGRDIGEWCSPTPTSRFPRGLGIGARAAPRLENACAPAPRPEAVAAEVAARTEAELARRDAHDTGREVSPLRQAERAVLVDGTHLDLEGVIDAIVALVHEAAGVAR